MRLAKNITLPLLGILIFTIAPFFITAFGVNEKMRVLVQLPALLLVIIGFFNMPRYRHNMYDTNGFMNFLFVFYMLQLVVMFLRGYSLLDRRDYNFFGYIYALTDPYYILWIFTPLVVLRLYPYFSLKGFIRISYWVCVIMGILALFSIPQIFHFSISSAMGVNEVSDMSTYMPGRIGLQFGALLLCIKYLSKKERIVVILSFSLNILKVVLLARRGALLMSLLLVVFCIWLYFNRGGGVKKIRFSFNYTYNAWFVPVIKLFVSF